MVILSSAYIVHSNVTVRDIILKDFPGRFVGDNATITLSGDVSIEYSSFPDRPVPFVFAQKIVGVFDRVLYKGVEFDGVKIRYTPQITSLEFNQSLISAGNCLTISVWIIYMCLFTIFYK